MSLRCCIAVVILLSLMDVASAQGTFGPRTVGGGVRGSSGRNSTRQEGQVSSANAIQRQEGSFVGGQAGGIITAPSSSGAGLGGMGGLGGFGMGGMGGMGLGGLNMGGMGLGGLGMGGMGGYGMGGFGMGGMGGMSGMGRRGMGNFGNQFNRGGQNQGRQRTINAPMRLGFAPTPVSPTVASARFAQRLTRLPQVKDAGQVTVRMNGGTVVLQGVVATERDRMLIERLALLEPGVNAVQNDLQLDPTAATVNETP